MLFDNKYCLAGVCKMKMIYHHIGIPTNEIRAGEKYSSLFKMYTSGGEGPARIQYHRFEEGSPLHPLLRTKPHVAFKVDNFEEAIAGKKVILEPYEPFKNFRVACTDEGGWPVEYIETNLSESEIWDDKAHINSVIYPGEVAFK